MQLFYTPHISKGDTTFVFDKTESKHIVKVLRKKMGDQLFITNGEGEFITSEISSNNDKNCRVTIINSKTVKKPWNYYLHVAIAPTKNIDRLEWFLEKATEIGIDEVSLLICDRSERKVVKMERLSRIVVSAMKQSLKFQLPKLNMLTPFSDFIELNNDGNLFIGHCEKSQKETLKSSLESLDKTTKKRITILIGPEGDFSISEIALAVKKGYQPIALGESRLRTETAGIVAVQTVSLLV